MIFVSSSGAKVHPGHIQLTRHLPRGSELVSATVERVDLVTPTVTTLQLSLSEESELRFAPGQWVDMYIPGVDVIGGFSLVRTRHEQLVTNARGTHAQYGVLRRFQRLSSFRA
eukprot:scaffold207_cov267-Pinguiococcus_pyrenoidosus.AAC.22